MRTDNILRFFFTKEELNFSSLIFFLICAIISYTFLFYALQCYQENNNYDLGMNLFHLIDLFDSVELVVNIINTKKKLR